MSILKRFAANYKKILAAGLFLIFGILLLEMMYKGLYSRYLQDDYCYGANTLRNGFFKMQLLSFTSRMPYNGNRYALNLFYALDEVFAGVYFERFLPALQILMWLASMTFLVFQIADKFFKRIKGYQALLFAAILVVFIIYLSPDTYQLIYWRAGRLTYTISVVFNTYLFARILQLSGKKIRWHHFIELPLICFIAEGFSEPDAVFTLFVWTLFALLVMFFWRKMKNERAYRALTLAVWACSVIGMILLLLAPANHYALMGASVKRADLPTFITLSLRYGFDFIKYSLTGKWLPFFVLFAFGFGFSRLLDSQPKTSPRRSLALIAVSSLLVYLISVACCTPSVLIRSVYPDPRAFMAVHFSLAIAVAVIGFLIGEISFSVFNGVQSQRLLSLLTAVLFLGLLAYSARMIPMVVNDVSPLKARAAAWDQRQEYIYQQKAAGETNITVPAFDNIDRITEIKEDAAHWVNVCVASYYGIDSIQAVENYNGVKPYFQ